MHKLDRTLAARPACLDNYDHTTHKWGTDNDGIGPCKHTIRRALEVIQGRRCAYCEGPLYDGAHIEHFRRKNPAHFPELTFEWTNLFLSCQSRDHCGHYKDRRGGASYSPDDLIKPDVDDPDAFLYFHSNGEVRVRGKLSPCQATRATETIRVFALDHPTLKADRRVAVARYLRSDPGNVDAILELEPEDREFFLKEELKAISDKPYVSAIRHFLESAI